MVTAYTGTDAFLMLQNHQFQEHSSKNIFKSFVCKNFRPWIEGNLIIDRSGTRNKVNADQVRKVRIVSQLWKAKSCKYPEKT